MILPNMPAALCPGKVHRYSNSPDFEARNTMAVAEPFLEISSDLALKSGSAISCVAPSPLTRFICTTASSGTSSDGLSGQLMLRVSPLNTSLPSEISVRKVKVISGLYVTSSLDIWSASATPGLPAKQSTANSARNARIGFMIASLWERLCLKRQVHDTSGNTNQP